MMQANNSTNENGLVPNVSTNLDETNNGVPVGDQAYSNDIANRITSIPSNISNIRKENVEFEKRNIGHGINQQKQARRIFKIIVIGDSNVGKTCLTYRFCGGRFLQRSEATIGVDFREKTVQIDDEAVKLQIWDTGYTVF